MTRLKAFAIIAVVSMALAPAAQAQDVVFSMPCPMMVHTPASSSCCADKCECSIQTPSPELASLMPSAAPSIELASSPKLSQEHFSVPSSGARPIADEEGSPPAPHPLYQAYSDYRL